MTKLSTFSRDARAMRDGDWISPGPEYGEIEIKTRAMGPTYSDARAAMIRREARLAGGEQKIGQKRRNEIDLECLIKHCLLDVRGLTHDDDTAVTFAEFCDLLPKPEHAELAVLAFTCAGLVGQSKAVQIEEATGNS